MTCKISTTFYVKCDFSLLSPAQADHSWAPCTVMLNLKRHEEQKQQPWALQSLTKSEVASHVSGCFDSVQGVFFQLCKKKCQHEYVSSNCALVWLYSPRLRNRSYILTKTFQIIVSFQQELIEGQSKPIHKIKYICR